jgi:hypothetical protein
MWWRNWPSTWTTAIRNYFEHWQKGNATFTGMAFFRTPSYNLSDRGAARRVRGALVTRNMLDVLGLKPAIGRNFSPQDDTPGGANVVPAQRAAMVDLIRALHFE